MSRSNRAGFASATAAFLLAASLPSANAQTPGSTSQPASGATFQCTDGSKLVLNFAADAGDRISAMIWLRGETYRLPNLPSEPGPARIVWSDGEHSLTWSPGVQLMWMGDNTHLMCGRSGHKH